MKKLYSIVCILLLLFSFASCTQPQEELTEPSTTQASPPVAATVAAEESGTVLQNITDPTQAIAPVADSTVLAIVTETSSEATASAETTVVQTEIETQSSTVQIEPETQTEAVITEPTTEQENESETETTTLASTTQAIQVCYITIQCATICDNLDNLKSSKIDFVPADGVILENVAVPLSGTQTVFDILKQVCGENPCSACCRYCSQSGVQLEYSYSVAFDNYYIEGIHQIYEKDCGSQSGWMYSVNGIFPSVGSSEYVVNPGDHIVFAYTCNMGADIGNAW